MYIRLFKMNDFSKKEKISQLPSIFKPLLPTTSKKMTEVLILFVLMSDIYVFCLSIKQEILTPPTPPPKKKANSA